MLHLQHNRLCASLQMTGSDYLEHSLLFGVLESILKDKKKALRILDLGCGDAGNISKVLSSEPTLVASYTGKPGPD